MPLAGAAFLALWNDIADPRVADYDQWHTLEHVPERVSVRGFRGARRYVNRDHAYHRYFTLYDVDSLAAFGNAEYKDLLDHPTPWSRSMRPDFRNFLRATCGLTQTKGVGIGGAIGCLCVPSGIGDDALSAALDGALTLSRITGVHHGRRSDPELSVPFAGTPSQTAPMLEFDRVALVEALDRPAAATALATLRAQLGLDELRGNCTCGAFDLAFVFPGSDPDEKTGRRRPAWAA